MKNLLLFMIILYMATSCKKEEEETIAIQRATITEDLKEIIKSNGIQALQKCCEGCSCFQSNGYGTDYSFTGDNFVRIRTDYYNLNKLLRYKLQTITQPSTEKRLILYFEK